MSYRPLALGIAVAALSSMHIASAAAQSVYVAPGGVYTTFFQFSKQRGSILPTHFGDRYGEDLRRIGNLQALLHANVTGLRLSTDAARLDLIYKRALGTTRVAGTLGINSVKLEFGS